MKGANRVLEKILWNLFVNTGDIYTYLYYKNCEDKAMEQGKNKRRLMKLKSISR